MHVVRFADDDGVGLVHVELEAKVVGRGPERKVTLIIPTLPSTTMKPLSPLLLLVALFSFSTSVYAQYFSAGWKPGQKVVQEDADGRAWTPGDHPEGRPPPPSDTGAEPPAEAPFQWSRLLTEGPIGNALLKVGLNLSAAREEAERRKANMWDKRIPLITDGNYESIIVNETFSSEVEERERVWFLIV